MFYGKKQLVYEINIPFVQYKEKVFRIVLTQSKLFLIALYSNFTTNKQSSRELHKCHKLKNCLILRNNNLYNFNIIFLKT